MSDWRKQLRHDFRQIWQEQRVEAIVAIAAFSLFIISMYGLIATYLFGAVSGVTPDLPLIIFVFGFFGSMIVMIIAALIGASRKGGWPL